MGAWRGGDDCGQVVSFLNEFRSRLSVVRVDSIGVGYNLVFHLRACRFPVEAVKVSWSCESQPNWGENDPSWHFANVKASMYQALADAFERDQVEGLTDETTIGQLAGILTEFDSHGRLTIESKEEARKRGASSFDRAEALMLALGKPYQKFEFYTIHDLRRLTSKSTGPASVMSHPYFGFDDLGDDDGDDERDPWAGLVGKRRWPRGRVCW